MSPNLGYKKEKYQCNAYSVKRSECSCKEKTDQKIKMSKNHLKASHVMQNLGIKTETNEKALLRASVCYSESWP